MIMRPEQTLALHYNSLASELAEYSQTSAVSGPKDYVPPIGACCVVALGKSHAAAKLAGAAAQPVAVLVPTHSLADEYTESSPVLHHHYGRQEPGSERPQNSCFKLGVVAEAGSKNHRPAASVCSKCPHGAQAVLDGLDARYGAEARIKGGMEPEENVRAERAAAVLKRERKTEIQLQPCRFLFEALPESLQAERLVLPVSSFADSFGEHGQKDNKRQRLVIVDEHMDFASEIKVTPGSVSDWRDQIKQAMDREVKKNTPESAERATFFRGVDALFARLIGWLAVGEPLGDAQVAEVVALAKQAKEFKDMAGGTASWEAVRFSDDGGSAHVPLRALAALATSLKAGVTRVAHNGLMCYEVAPPINWAIRKGRTVFLDATMPRELRAIILAKGGQLLDHQVAQNIRVTRYSGHLYARGRVRSGSYSRVASSYMRELERVAADFPVSTAIITHKSYLQYATEYAPKKQLPGPGFDHQASASQADRTREAFQARTGRKIGWFGLHDRGHNEWKFHNIVVVGMPLVSTENVASLYACTRAAVLEAGAPVEDWPEFDQDDMTDGEETHHVPLPRQPTIRRWLLEHYAATIAQAVGRARGARHEGSPLEIAIVGGLDGPDIDEALARFGLQISDVQPNLWHRSTPGCKPGADDSAIDAAAFDILTTGASPAWRTLGALMRCRGLTVADGAIKARLGVLRARGQIPPAQRGRTRSVADELNGAECIENSPMHSAPFRDVMPAASGKDAAQKKGRLNPCPSSSHQFPYSCA